MDSPTPRSTKTPPTDLVRSGRSSGLGTANGDGWPTWTGRDDCLRHTLFRFGDDSWKIADSVEGTQIFGGTGSGKTSGSGRAIAREFIRAGFGGLVLTAKPDDLLQWVRYLRAAGLTDAQISERLIVVEPPGGRHPSSVWPTRAVGGRETQEPLDLPVCQGFNFLEYEHAASGLTQDIVSLFLNTMSAGGAAVSKSDPYWDEALRELLTHAVDLAVWGTKAIDGQPSIRLEDLVAIIRTAPQSRTEAASTAWRNPTVSRCWRLIEAANERLAKQGQISVGRLGDLSHTIDYWMNDFPSLSDRTRSVIVSSFTAKAAGLLRHPLRELLCSKGSSPVNAFPERTHEGKIVVLNLPVKLYGEVGKFAQTIWKTIWQRATERRVGTLDRGWGQHRPVFLWADESQYFISREDALFQQTARSALAATVYLTQNISNYYAALGGDSSKSATDSLLGNLQTKIFHANGDPATNEWAERLFGKKWTKLSSQGVTLGTSLNDTGGGGTSSQGSSQVSWQHASVVEAREFLTLTTGGYRYQEQVQSIILKAGRRWFLRDANNLTVRGQDGQAEDLDDQQRPISVLRHTFNQND